MAHKKKTWFKDMLYYGSMDQDVVYRGQIESRCGVRRLSMPYLSTPLLVTPVLNLRSKLHLLLLGLERQPQTIQ